MSTDFLSTKVDGLPTTLYGRFVYKFLPYRRRMVLQNMRQVFQQQLTAKQLEHLAIAFYSHLLTSIKEMFLMRFMTEEQLKNLVEVRGYQHLVSMSQKNHGILILTGHFGNWELTPIGGILNFKEFQGRFHFIRRTLVNKFIERIVFKRYYQAGLNVIPQKNSLQNVCDVLEKNHAVVFVLDQHASLVNRDGIAVEFFGKKAGTYRSLASIARYTGLAVIPAASYRIDSSKHILEFYQPILWQDQSNIQDTLYYNTLQYNQALEKIILSHPEQWNWFHKRWKLNNI